MKKYDTARLGLLLMLATSLLCQPRLSNAQEPFDRFGEYVESARIEWNAPGLAVAVVHHDQVAFMSGFGTRDLSTGDPVDEHTLFHVGSTTKAFTAAGLGVLIEQGKLDWDDRVIDHLPSFRVEDPYVTRELAVRDLLCHRSGVQNTNLFWARGYPSNELLSHLSYAKQSSSLRSEFEYNDGMYIVAGNVIETVSGKSFPEFIRETFFVPLGMNRTTGPIHEIAERANVATSHDVILGEMTPIGLTDQYDAGGAGLFYSSVSDYVNWLRLWLSNGTVDNQTILDASTIRTAFTPQFVLRQPIYPAASYANVDLCAYGLGWFLHEYRGRRVNMHTGSIDGMSAIVGLMPEENVGVVVFINADHVELRHALMYRVFDCAIGNDIRDWSAELLNVYQPEESSESQTNSEDVASGTEWENALPLDQYIGRFQNDLFGDAIVEMKDDQLTLRLDPLMKAALRPAGDHRFTALFIRRGFDQADDAYKYLPAITIQFEIDGDNRPAGMLFGGGQTVFELIR